MTAEQRITAVFVVGDHCAGALTGVVTAVAVRALIGPDWDMALAMLAGTAVGMAAHLAIQFGYAAWLGQPWATPIHRMQNGAFLLFTFFMISDPRTTPDSRAGRALFAVLVAAGAAVIQFVLYRTNGLLWSLALFSITTPLIDRLLPGPRYAWPGHVPEGPSKGGRSPRKR